MTKSMITKHDIYDKLAGVSERDLQAIAVFIDFVRHQKKSKGKKLIKLEGILKDYDVDFSALKEFKDQSWRHLEREFADG